MTAVPDKESSEPGSNLDPATVEGFGEEWSFYDQTGLSEQELDEVFSAYFAIFPWEDLPSEGVGFDLGCGSGRWARRVAPRVRQLHCVDASEKALAVAERSLSSFPNCRFHHASVDQLPFDDQSMDFGYSLGVLHHVPDTEEGIRACVAKLKVGAPFLLYLYYAFDNRPDWFRYLWRGSDAMRRFISVLPHAQRRIATEVLAAVVYWPMARTSALLERLGVPVSSVPLSFYRRRSFYTMRTDALDRFGTRLEQRFSRGEILGMMERSGLVNVRFSESEPFWCAVGIRGPENAATSANFGKA